MKYVLRLEHHTDHSAIDNIPMIVKTGIYGIKPTKDDNHILSEGGSQKFGMPVGMLLNDGEADEVMHPSPPNDSSLDKSIENLLLYKEEIESRIDLVFGFKSLTQLKSWFFREDLLEHYKDYFRLSIYRVKDDLIAYGRKQVCFPGTQTFKDDVEFIRSFNMSKEDKIKRERYIQSIGML